MALRGPWFALACLMAALYASGITAAALGTGLFCLIFPELGALAHDVFTRPQGVWNSNPVLLVATPALSALVGLLISRHLPYGYLSVLLAVGGAVAVLKLLRSKVAPAISAALLPVVFGERSWWYPLAVFFGVAGLALLAAAWKRLPAVARQISFSASSSPSPSAQPQRAQDAAPTRKRTLPDLSWTIVMGAFLAALVFAVKLTGARLLLYPPLAVVAFEMFTRPQTCPWAGKPSLLPVACCLSATGGFFACHFWGVGVTATAAAMIWSAAVLYLLKLYLPPAMAVGLIPLIVKRLTPAFPISITLGTLALSLVFLGYRPWLGQRSDHALATAGLSPQQAQKGGATNVGGTA